ncbi:hypothetical protein Vretimale_17018 [Volvox reticuliferus]|nr:hypothetical protein Vretimale_17018 [Volvox reticuliferus]
MSEFCCCTCPRRSRESCPEALSWDAGGSWSPSWSPSFLRTATAFRAARGFDADIAVDVDALVLRHEAATISDDPSVGDSSESQPSATACPTRHCFGPCWEDPCSCCSGGRGSPM